MDQMPADDALEGQSPSANQATISWAEGQIMVDMGQGPEPVEDIGAALQAVLDAYKEASEGITGESGYRAAFARDSKPQMRQPTAGDRAGAQRY